MIKNATYRNGGVYMYSNLKGCDGGRLYFDGASSITMNGEVLTQSPQFSVDDIDVEMATIDLDFVRCHRARNKSRATQSS